jgi:hypothetical protein
MRVRETVSSLLRRWYILMVGLLLTAAMCWVVQGRVPVTYEAKGSQVLMPPSATVGEGNPYLYLGGLSQALDVLIRHVNAAEVTQPVLRAFPGTAFSVEADGSTSGSILVISASGSTPEGTLGVLQAALDKIPAALKDMQDELAIADRVRINVRTVVVDGQATKNNQSQMRLVLLAAGGGTVGTVLLTAMMDNFLSGRKKPTQTDGEKGATPGDEDSEDKDGGQPSGRAVTEDPGRPEPRSNTMRQRSQAGSGASSR